MSIQGVNGFEMAAKPVIPLDVVSLYGKQSQQLCHHVRDSSLCYAVHVQPQGAPSCRLSQDGHANALLYCYFSGQIDCYLIFGSKSKLLTLAITVC